MLDAALALARRGLLVFPLHTPTGNAARPCSCGKADCKSVGKHPRTRDGLKGGSADETQIRRWWEMWPDANIGLVTGARSGPAGLVVLDIDGPRGEQSIKDGGYSVDDAPQVMTGKGRHVYYRQDNQWLKNFTGRLPGVDLRAEGGYVVAPPSLHANGKRYEWLDGQDIEALQGLPPVPAWIIALAREGARDVDGVARSKLADKRDLGEGERNAGLASLGGRLRRAGMEGPEIEIALQAANRERCKPPLDDAEVTAIAESVARYAPGEMLGHGAPDDELMAASQAVAELLRTQGVAPQVIEEVNAKAHKAVQAKREQSRAMSLEIVEVVHRVAAGDAAVFDVVLRYGDKVATMVAMEAASLLSYKAVLASALAQKLCLPVSKEAASMWPSIVMASVDEAQTVERAPEEDVVSALIDYAREWMDGLELVDDPIEVMNDPRNCGFLLTEDGGDVLCFSGKVLQANWVRDVPDAKRKDWARAQKFLGITRKLVRSKTANKVLTFRAVKKVVARQSDL